MAREKKDTIVFKQTLSNIAFKAINNAAKQEGVTVQDLIRQLVSQAYVKPKTH